MPDAELKITGMSCAACVRRVEKSLEKIGVRAEVNLAGESVRIPVEQMRGHLKEIIAAVKAQGYGVAPEHLALSIGGMTCANCVRILEAGLKKLPGVLNASVNLATEKAAMDYIPSLVSPGDMFQAVRDMGYLPSSEEAAPWEDAHEKELSARLRQAAVGLTAGVVLLMIMFLPMPQAFPSAWLMFAIATPAFLYAGLPVFRSAWHALKSFTLTMEVMYALGTSVAYGSSVLATMGILPRHEFLFYDTAVLLSAFLALGRYLEGKARGKTSRAIRALLDLQPRKAAVIRDGAETEILAEEVRPGDLVRVRPGEQIPVDGDVAEGASFVNEAMISGESAPVSKKTGDAVLAGTLNVNGTLVFKALKVGRETVLAQIIRLVEEAQAGKPPIQRLADKAVVWFIPVVLGLALLTGAAWMLLSSQPVSFILGRVIAVLVIACPCALGLATPTAVAAGIGRGAELGIYVKSGTAVEKARSLTTVVFDKTGTLTKGVLAVAEVSAWSGSEGELLALAAALEQPSQHPLGKAITAEASRRRLTLESVGKFDTIEGLGVKGRIGGRDVFIGSPSAPEATLSAVQREAINALEEQGRTVVILSREGTTLGCIAVSDTLREGAAEAVRRLKNMGIEVHMLTGDNARAAARMAEEAGIEHFTAGVRPDGKAAFIRELQDKGGVTAFAGDGINDAPALACADIGIAMGGGTDVARESGEIVLMREDPRDAVTAILLCRRIIGQIRWNIFWAIAYNALLIPFAAGALYPSFHILLPPELAAGAMALSSFSVVTLSLTLRRFKPQPPERRSAGRPDSSTAQ